MNKIWQLVNRGVLCISVRKGECTEKYWPVVTCLSVSGAYFDFECDILKKRVSQHASKGAYILLNTAHLNFCSSGAMNYTGKTNELN